MLAQQDAHMWTITGHVAMLISSTHSSQVIKIDQLQNPDTPPCSATTAGTHFVTVSYIHQTTMILTLLTIRNSIHLDPEYFAGEDLRVQYWVLYDIILIANYITFDNI